MEQASGKKSTTKESHNLPVLVWWHSGGAVSGSKSLWVPHWLFREFEARISLDDVSEPPPQPSTTCRGRP